MSNTILIQDLRYVFEETELKVWKRVEKIILNMYWQVGYCLKDYSEQEVVRMSKEFALLFDVHADLFPTAYRFYRENPIKKHIGRVGG